MDWTPRTKLGKMVAEGAVTLEDIFRTGKKIKETEIVDKLLPNLQNDIILIGGSPGKGGGIKRTPTRRTARMHRSGRRYRISALAVVGNNDGYIGVGKATALENREAVDKAIENAKLNLIPVRRGCGSWECMCGEAHSVPVKVEGKSGSVRVVLVPAPKGIGLCINDEAKKFMKLAGIRDIWSKSYGETKSRVNYSLALYDAFRKMNRMKFSGEEYRTPGQPISEEAVEEESEEAEEMMEEFAEAEEQAEEKENE